MPAHVVRPATAADMSAVCELIQEMSDMDNVSEKVQLTVDDLVRDGGFDPIVNAVAYFHCFVAEQTDGGKAVTAGPIVGYAMCFLKTFTIKRRAMFVDSLHVRGSLAKPLRQNIQRDLAQMLCTFARDSGCYRVDFHLLADSDLLPIWEQLGAEDLTASMGLRHLRLHADAIEALIDDV